MLPVPAASDFANSVLPAKKSGKSGKPRLGTSPGRHNAGLAFYLRLLRAHPVSEDGPVQLISIEEWPARAGGFA